MRIIPDLSFVRFFTREPTAKAMETAPYRFKIWCHHCRTWWQLEKSKCLLPFMIRRTQPRTAATA